MASRWILVVDDDPDIRESIREILELDRHTVREAENGREALATLARERPPPCVVVLDLMMPVMNGYETLQRIRSDAQLRDVPVVIASAAREIPDGATAVLRKPFSFEALVAAIAPHCRA